jgi:TRAP-type C4-dicarboxylate transport system substrate-binding protein
MRPIHEKAGYIYLGSCNIGESFHLYSNFKVEKLSDFKGKKFRVFPAIIPFIEALGAIPVNLPIMDIYTAMDRGAVAGFVFTELGFVKDFSWHEVTKYVIDYNFYTGSTALLVNPKSWNRLSKDVQNQIWAYKKKEVDPLIEKYFTDLSTNQWDLLINKGVKPLRFSSDADADKYVKIAYDAAWKELLAKSPELGAKLKKILVK